jgi:CubicO group peptidase (beta-lactamase class C family)/C-terminal processing protease CtpA/Prc
VLARAIAAACLVVCVVAQASAQATVAAGARTAQAYLDSLRLAHNLPGLSAAVVIGDRILWEGGSGVADTGTSRPFDSSTLSRVGSVSKLLTAVAAARLVDQGLLDLDRPIREYLHSLTGPLGDVTARQLAGHLAGVRHYNRAEFVSRTAYGSVSASLDRFLGDSLLGAPGERYLYSSYGYNLLGAVLESAAGREFRDLIRREVTGPLGLGGIIPSDPNAPDGQPTYYWRANDGRLEVAPSVDLSDRWPSGGFLATAADLARFGAGVMRSGYLTPAAHALLFSTQRTHAGEATGVGLGWRIARDSAQREFVHHGGEAMGARAFLLVYPERQLAVALLTNLTFAPIGEREALTLASIVGTSLGAQSDDGQAAIARLAGLARVWGVAKYFHPALAGPTIDWDAALVDAIPEVKAAQTDGEHARAVQRMLSRLGDPLTRVVMPLPMPSPASSDTFAWHVTPDSVLVLRAGNYYALSQPHVRTEIAKALQTISSVRSAVFDLRASAPTDAFARMQLASTFAEAERLVTTDTLAVPGSQHRVYYGFETPSPFSSGQYRTGFFIRAAPSIVPARRAADILSVFVLNQHAGSLPAMTPLQAAGKARIVYQGDLATHTIGEVIAVPLGGGLQAQVRRSVAVFPDGTSGAFRPDTIIGEGAARSRDPALEAAISLARVGQARARLDRAVVPITAPPLRERSNPEMTEPRMEYRLLAAFRLWNAIQHFYPYKHLLDQSWDSVLAEMIPTFEGAEGAHRYVKAVAEMATRIQDSHSFLSGTPVDEHLIGPGYPPVRVRAIEDALIITAIHDSGAARSAGVVVGDIVVAVDGTPASERLAETAHYLSTSTPQSRTDRAALTFMNGPVGSAVRLTLRDAAGSTREVQLIRRREDFSTLYHRERTGEVVRVLPGNLGYVDLDRLTFDMVDPMFERLAATRGIIFDMRGYPRGTVWMIAPRLADQPRQVALFSTPLPGHTSPEPATERFAQIVQPAPPEKRYRGPTVMLIDERTVSQAEHTGLYLRAANGTRFVGSASAGANGEITSITLPGGITVGFTGQEVRFPDGRQLQRAGLAPDVAVKPTIAGIRAGRDEVLEAAVRLLGGN